MKLFGTLRGWMALSLAMMICGLPAQAQEGLFLRGATVIDGVAEAPYAASLVIAGGTIAKILPADAPAPANAQIVDLDGLFVIPGLVESHSHWESWMAELYINHGVTSVIALEDLPAQVRMASQEALNGPRLFHSGNRPVFDAGSTAEEARAAVRAWLARAPDIAHFPTYNADIAAAYRAAAEEAHAAGFIIFGHAENAPEAMEAGLDVVEHVWGFTQATMSAMELAAFQRGDHLTWATFTTDWAALDRMIADAVARGAYLNPTLLYEWGAMSPDAPRREIEDYRLISNPDLVYFPREIAETLLARHRQIKNFSARYENMPMISDLPPGARAEFADGYTKVLEFVRRFAQAGGKIMAGTDVISGGVPGLSLHQEMEVLVEAGLTPVQALKAATSWSAEFLEGKNGARGNSRLGVLAAGNFADLVVLEANPLTDIANTKRIARVMKSGRWVTLEYHPEFITLTEPATQVQATALPPQIAVVTPSRVNAGAGGVRVVVEGSGFTLRSLVQVDGISVKTDFVSPRRVEFDLPAPAVASIEPNPYTAPGPAQHVGVLGDRAVAIRVLNPPPAGGMSNTVYQLVVRP